MSSLAFILGREPHVSVAEIAAVLPDAEWARAELGAEALVLSVRDVGEDFMSSRDRSGGDEPRPYAFVRSLMDRLGGTIKIGEVFQEIPNSKLQIPNVETIGQYILEQTHADRKVHFGYSVYDLGLRPGASGPEGGGRKYVEEVRHSLVRGAAAQKAWLKEHGRTVRWVMSREPTLSSVVVQKNDLLPERNGVEVLVLVGTERITFARTLAVQPFEAWGERDYGKPARSMTRGMLPPKLARMMINIAIARSGVNGQMPNVTILDPFCGTGTVLLEALQFGCRAIGSDVDPDAIAETRKNIQWLIGRLPHPHSLPLPAGGGEKEGAEPISVRVEQCDARQLSRCVNERVDAIVTEPFLGPARWSGVNGQVSGVVRELHALYVAAFREFAKVLKPGGRAVFVVPEFRLGAREHPVDIMDDVIALGFRSVDPFPPVLRDHHALRGKSDLPYARSDQRVGRRTLVFARK